MDPNNSHKLMYMALEKTELYIQLRSLTNKKTNALLTKINTGIFMSCIGLSCTFWIGSASLGGIRC